MINLRPMLDKRFLDELRTRLTLSDVIGRRVKLVRGGRELKACCPFHQEKSPSFTVNDAKGFFHCFGCGAHGDVVSFRMRMDNVTFMEAVESLASEAGLEVPKQTMQSPEKMDELQRLRQTLEQAARWFETQLHQPQYAFALRYLRERGVSDDMIAQYRLGFAPNNWDALREAMLAQNMRIDDLQTVGLLRESTREDKADKPYSFFRGRIMFPVADTQGRVIAFGGRHLDAAFAGQNLPEKPPKYINSAEHPLFNKSAVLYGLARARSHVSAQSPLLLCEGYMDVISLAQGGFATAVAPLGTALTEDHMTLAWKVSLPEQPPILCFDGDKAGLNAAYRAIERLLPQLTAHKTLKLLFLPGGEDPDSLLKAQGPAAFRNLLGQAMGVFDALWQREVSQTPSTPEGRAGLQARLEEQIRQIGDPVLQHSYRQALKDRLYQLNRSNFTTKKSDKPFKGKNNLPTHSNIIMQKPGRQNVLRDWQVVLLTAINHPFILEQMGENLGLHSIPDPALEALREALLLLVHQHPPGDEPLTSDRAKQFLSDRGLNDMLASLNHNAIYQLFSFTRPETPADQVLAGLQDVWARMQLKTVTQDMIALRHEVRTSYSEETAERITAFGQQQQTLLDDKI